MADDLLALLSREEAYEAINDVASAQAVASPDRDPEFVGVWVPAISRRVDELCGPVVVRTVTDERHDGGRRFVALRFAPASRTSATTITSAVEYAGVTERALTAETDVTKPAQGFLFDPTLGLLYRRSGNGDAWFAAGRRNVKITYEAGRYATTATVDAKFKLAAGAILRRLWSREAGAWARGGDPFTEAGVGPGFFKAIDPMVNEFLSDEMRPPMVG